MVQRMYGKLGWFIGGRSVRKRVVALIRIGGVKKEILNYILRIKLSSMFLNRM